MVILKNKKLLILYIDGYNPRKETYMIDSLRKILSDSCKLLFQEVNESRPIETFNTLKPLSKKADIIIGYSMGGFYTDLLECKRKIFINPAFKFYDIVKAFPNEFRVNLKELEELNRLPRLREWSRSVMILGDNDYKIKSTGVEKIFRDEYKGEILTYPGKHLIDYQSMEDLVPKAVSMVL